MIIVIHVSKKAWEVQKIRSRDLIRKNERDIAITGGEISTFFALIGMANQMVDYV